MEKPCTTSSPSWFTGHWRDWHRGHGCDRDDGKPRSEDAVIEIAQHAVNRVTGFLTDAELRMLRAATSSGNELLVRALDELVARRLRDRYVALRPDLAHCMMGPPGHRCSCGSTFDDYYALADHVRQFINCPRCGVAPTDLGEGELYRWQCGHWIARGDASATIRAAEEAP